MGKTDFTKSASPERAFVNYVWLCPRKVRKSSSDPATKLPLHYFERLYQNAEKYPDAEFNLWLDFEQLALVDRFFLDSHRYLFEAQSIKIRNLRDLPEYRDSPGFDADSNIALYARADCARILVLNHLLNKHRNKTIIYSDLDCEDIGLTSPDVRESLLEFGMAFGRSGTNKACNGYIALSGKVGKNFMSEFLLPRTLNAFQKNLINHFGAFAKAIRRYRRENHPELSFSHWGRVDLPLMRTLMPYDENMYEGVCIPRKTRVPGSKELV